MMMFLLAVLITVITASPLVEVPKSTENVYKLDETALNVPKIYLGLNQTKVGEDIFDCPNPLEAVTLIFSDVFYYRNPSLYDSLQQLIYIPESGVLRAPITCITVRDQNPVDAQGSAVEIGGGVGEFYLQLNLISARGKDISVKVELFSL